MLKRSATTDLNHDNWNDEDESEEPNDFKLASPEVMKNRVIRTGKRRLQPGNSTAPSTPFAKFNFGAGSTSNSVSTPFSFLSKDKASITTNGHSMLETIKEDDKKDESKKVSEEEEIKDKYFGKLKNLNEQCLSWITHHIGKNKTCILTPIFEDYAKYLKECQSERDGKLSSISKTQSPKSNAELLGGFKFSGPPSTTSASSSFFKSTSTTSTSGEANPMTGGLGLSFFGNVAKPSNPIANEFSFGAVKPFGSGIKPFASGTPMTESKAEALAVPSTEESEEPPKNEFTPVTENDAVFTQKVKVYVKKDEEYADRGVGMLYIKPANDKYQTIVRADTSLGNLLLNIILSESMPIKRMGKNNVLLVCIPIPGPDAKPMPTLLKVKTTEEADKLLDELTRYKK